MLNGSLSLPGACAIGKSYDRHLETISFFILLSGFPLAVVGIVTSILSFAMFNKDRVTPKTTRFLLKTVSITDALFLVLFILYIEVSVIGRKTYKPPPPVNGTRNTAVPFYKEKSYLVTVLVSVQIVEIFRNWITVLIGIERFIVVFIPLKAPQVCTKRRTVFTCIILGLFSVLVRTPLLIRRILASKRLIVGKDLTPAEQHTKLLVNRLKTIHDLLDTIFMLIIPLIILIFCTQRIIRSLHKSSDYTCGNTTQHARDLHKRNVKVTWMLLAVIIIFGVCTIPYIIFTVSKFIPTCESRMINRMSVPIIWLSTVVYSTGNFFVYVLFMKKYRQILCRMIRRSGHSQFNERTNEYTLVYRNSMPSIRR